jgi:hypothetical protein
MKLTKRGKRLRALLILAGIVAFSYGTEWVLTHHKVYGNCRYTIEGKECDLLRWEKNK